MLEKKKKKGFGKLTHLNHLNTIQKILKGWICVESIGLCYILEQL